MAYTNARAFVDNGDVVRLFQVSCRETWRFRSPTRDRPHRIEPCSPNGHPRGTNAFPLREVVEGSSAAPPSTASKAGAPWSECVCLSG